MGTVNDGRTCDSVRIDSNFRMHTATVSETEADHANDLQKKYNIDTGDITLTNAVKTSVLYIKNNEDDPLIVLCLIYDIGNTAGGTGDIKIEIIRNPLAGDIITNANDVEIGPNVSANQNFGSTDTLSGLFYKGATGETVVSGGGITNTVRSAANTGRIIIDQGTIVLTKGSAIAIDYTPPASNTSQIVQFSAVCYLKTKIVSDTD